LIEYTPIIKKLSCSLFSEKEIDVFVLRLDLMHPEIGGNKWFKLKFNLAEAKKQNHDTILTFGGAFSNHIHATAVACKLSGFKSIGIIRGEPEAAHNPTLGEARANGMQLHFVTREEYRNKEESYFIEKLKQQFGNFYLIPEGGNNLQGAIGCGDILKGIPVYEYIFCACGTATTFAGIASHLKPGQKLIGILVLKGENTLIETAQQLINKIKPANSPVVSSDPDKGPAILNDYTFGGYAKHTSALLQFKESFERDHSIPLDYIYTSKLFYGVFDLISSGKLAGGAQVLIIHSGGLQGNRGYEERYHLKLSR